MDFKYRESGESIAAYWGSKKSFESALHFWIYVLRAEAFHYDGDSIELHLESGPGLFKPLSEEEFAEIVESHSVDLREPLPRFILELAGFHWGMQMSEITAEEIVSLEVGLVGELSEGFVAFFWESTA